jgi:hypothetical protein
MLSALFVVLISCFVGELIYRRHVQGIVQGA